MQSFLTPITALEQATPGLPYNPPVVKVTNPRSLEGVNVALIASHGFEQVEVTYPVDFLVSRGAKVDVITPDWLTDGLIAVQFIRPTGLVRITKQISAARVEDYRMIVIPGGGFNPIVLRGEYNTKSQRCEGPFLDFVRKANEEELLIAAVCHGPQVLISADIIRGRMVTGVPDIRVDLINAGGVLVADSTLPPEKTPFHLKAVCDGNLITSPSPVELPEFCQAIEEYFTGFTTE